MTRLPPLVSRSPMRLLETAREDRRTHRKWVRISLACYFLLIAGLIMAGVSMHVPSVQTVSEGQTAALERPLNLSGNSTQVGEASNVKLPYTFHDSHKK